MKSKLALHFQGVELVLFRDMLNSKLIHVVFNLFLTNRTIIS